jgi:hypothetical protein
LIAEFSRKTRKRLEGNSDTQNCPKQVDNFLRDFFTSLNKADGTELSITSFNTIKYGVSRVLKKKLHMDILKDEAFKVTRDICISKNKKLKSVGKGAIKHHDIIPIHDLKKISDMAVDTPVTLQLKVWFLIQYHFALRGREFIAQMKKSDIHVAESSDGHKTAYLRDFASKNHQLGTGPSTEACIFATNDEQCPIKMIEMYISKLDPQCEYMWQLCMKRTDTKWYANSKIGVNTAGDFMKKLSKYLNLSQMFTNHCVRATAITLLGTTHQDTSIQKMSGHSSLAALGIYKRISTAEVQSMSNRLHEALVGQPANSNAATTSSAVPAISNNVEDITDINYILLDFPLNIPIEPEREISTASALTVRPVDLPPDDGMDAMLASALLRFERAQQPIHFANCFNHCTVTFNVYKQ